MIREQYEVGERPKVKVEQVAGDLTVSARAGATLEAAAPEGARLEVRQTKDAWLVICTEDLDLVVPAEAGLQVAEVGGALKIEGLRGALEVGRVGGEVELRRVASARVEAAGGDLVARQVEGDLRVGAVGGDMLVLSLSGNLEAGRAGGDLRLRQVRGAVTVEAGGDAHLDLEPPPGSRSRVVAGGDLICRLPEGASLRLTVRAGGELRLPEAEEKVLRRGEATVVLGEGEAELELAAGGRAWVRADQGGEVEISPEEWGAYVASKVAESLEGVESVLETFGGGVVEIRASRLADRVGRAVARAMRRRGRGRREVSLRIERPGKRGAHEEERMMILRMVEQGKITAEEAARLLEALGEGR